MIRAILISLAIGGSIGCGGTVLGAGDGGAPESSTEASSDAKSDRTAPPDAGPDAPIADGGHDSTVSWSPVCPEEAPTVGSACSLPEMMDSPSIVCEYGKLQYDPSCDTLVQCVSGAWAPVTAVGTGCQPDGPNPTSCPASYAALKGMEGESCPSNGLRCEYPEAVCVCSRGFGGPVELDASLGWYCNPGAGCPLPRPRLGSTCSTNLQCTYFTCDFGESCTGGYWQAEFEGCAGAGSR
jgi:hypothetical protein